MKTVTAAILSAMLVSAGATLAQAADPTPANPGYPPQVATNPGTPYSYGRAPGPKTSSNNQIQSPSSAAPAAVAAPDANTGSTYYSGKGFGPKPN